MKTTFSPGALRKERERQALSQVDLALMLNVDPSMISYLESGRRVPSNALLTALADTLGIRVGRLFKRVPDAEPIPKLAA